MYLKNHREQEIEAIKKQYIKLVELHTQINNLEITVATNNVTYIITIESL